MTGEYVGYIVCEDCDNEEGFLRTHWGKYLCGDCHRARWKKVKE